MQLVEHTSELSHYAYVVAFLCIVLGLMWGRFKAMHVFAAPVLIFILSGFMGIKHIYATAVNPSILTVMALIALTGVLKKTALPPNHRPPWKQLKKCPHQKLTDHRHTQRVHQQHPSSSATNSPTQIQGPR